MNQDVQSELKKDELLHARLTDSQKGYLFSFCQNKAMVDAVEKALVYSVYEMGVVDKNDGNTMTINWAISIANAKISHEEKGKALDIMANALGALHDAFKQIRKFGEQQTIRTDEVNPAL